MEVRRKIRFLLEDGSEIIVALHDNPAADALYDMLPMELTFEDFNGTEKIAYLPEELPTDGSPNSCDPDVGSLCYDISWGNLCFFYQDFRISSPLIPLGNVESGGKKLDLAASETADRIHGGLKRPFSPNFAGRSCLGIAGKRKTAVPSAARF